MSRERSRLLPFEELRGLAEQLTVKLVMTPRIRFKTVAPKATVGEARNIMEKERFDQLPVEDKGKITGLVRCASISSASLDEYVDGYVNKPKHISETEPLSELILSLESEHCVLVDNEGVVTGLIHRSDLNKQAIRIYFYLWLAAAEMGLSEMIKDEYGPDETWIDKLSTQSKVTVLGKHALAQREGRDIHPIEYLDFSDLINVVTKDKEKKIWDKLGFTEKEWKEITGELVEFRHTVMHPIRTLVNEDSDIKLLKDCDDHLRKLIEALHKVRKIDEPSLENRAPGLSQGFSG